MFSVYNRTVNLPLIVRIPNGGHRGYGPTHSQSLEKHLVGIDNLLVVALTSLVDPEYIYRFLTNNACPSLVIENKVGYARILHQNPDQLIIEGNFDVIENLRIRRYENPEFLVYCYGEYARSVVDSLIQLEEEFQITIEVICLLQLHPIRIDSIRLGSSVIVVEEGSKEFGIGSEIAALLLENRQNVNFARIAAEPFPIPSNRDLEEVSLPSLDKLRSTIKGMVEMNVN
jgi:2-oxoisovalerate dehydrogenase E1 component